MLHHRHTRGKVDLAAEVCPNSFLDKFSTADAGSHIVNSTIVGSWIKGRAINSYVEDSVVNDGLIQGGRVINCLMEGGTIQGDAVVVGITVDKMMRIGTGTWTRRPRYFEIENDITHIGVTESTNGHAYISCQSKLMTTWIKGKRRFGRAVGWSDDVLDLLERNFTDWLGNPIPTF